MFYCNKKKFNWYLKRDLADIIEGEKKSIQLTFTPRGDGEKSIFLSEERQNICVVTGSDKNLTKHHVVPTQYRQYFPNIYKSKNSNDVVAICDEEHSNYERYADELKSDLIEKYILKDEIEYNKKLDFLRKTLNTLDKHEDKIPYDRLWYLYEKLEMVLKHVGIVQEEVDNLEKLNIDQLIVDRMGIEELIVTWKNHFVEYSKPKYLPDWWDPNHIKIVDIRQ
jgi:hypothetical protein